VKSSAIVTELKRLTMAHGGTLRPGTVVEAARDPQSPLHSAFDWEDSSAAAKYRLWQARQLINVVVTYEKVGDGNEVAHRVFVSLTPDRYSEDAVGYRLLTGVMGDEAQRRQLLADAKEDMRRFQAKYKTLTELAAVFAAMESVDTEQAIAV
jgi:hypothetical protein